MGGNTQATEEFTQEDGVFNTNSAPWKMTPSEHNGVPPMEKGPDVVKITVEEFLAQFVQEKTLGNITSEEVES